MRVSRVEPDAEQWRIEPELDLLWAMLEHAITDALGRASLAGRDPKEIAAARSRIKVEARAWFADDDDRPFSFVWTCEQLQFEASVIRRFLAEHDEGYFPPCRTKWIYACIEASRNEDRAWYDVQRRYCKKDHEQ